MGAVAGIGTGASRSAYRGSMGPAVGGLPALVLSRACTAPAAGGPAARRRPALPPAGCGGARRWCRWLPPRGAGGRLPRCAEATKDKAPAWPGLVMCRRRCPTGPEQGGSRFPVRTSTWKRSSVKAGSRQLWTLSVTRPDKIAWFFNKCKRFQGSCCCADSMRRDCDGGRGGAGRCIIGRGAPLAWGEGMARGTCACGRGCGRCRRSMSRQGDLPPPSTGGRGRGGRPSPSPGRGGRWPPSPLPCPGGGRWPPSWPCGGRGRYGGRYTGYG